VRLVYLGTPQIAVPPLEGLVAAGHDIALVVTGRDKRRGRGSSVSPSPVKAAAAALRIDVSHDVDDVTDVGAELGVVVAFGHIIKPHVLAAVPMVNLHFSLLPRWRGAAPLERALLAGDEMTGVCVMAVDEGLDTGGVYARVDVPILPTVTADELRSELVTAGTRLLVDTLAAGLGEPDPQIGTPTYAAKVTPAELRIDWAQPADRIDRVIRLGGAWTTFRGDRIKIHAADLVADRIVPTVVQPEGKGRMDADAWRRGVRPSADEWFE
jgi:methionyl-tRNA formyltransferase